MAGAAQGIVDFVRGFGERAKTAHVNSALKNYLTDPDATIAAVNQIDAPSAIALNRQHVADTTAATQAADARTKSNVERLTTVTKFLRGLPPGTDVGAAMDRIQPFLQNQMGMTPEAYATARAAITANPNLITELDDEAHKAALQVHVGAPGSWIYSGTNKIGEVPFAPDRPVVKEVRNADGSTRLDVVSPTAAVGATPGTAGAPAGGAVPLSTPWAQAKDIIGDREGPASLGGYDAVVYNRPGGGNAVGAAPPKPPTQMTMGEVYDFQHGPLRARTAGHRGPNDIGSTGMGRYQFESETLAENAEAAFGPNWRNVPFTPENQDKVGEHLYGVVQANPKMAPTTWAALAPGATPAAPGAAPSAAPAGAAVTVASGAPAAPFRIATPQELASYPPGTAAQVGPDGKFVNIKLPGRGAGNRDPEFVRRQAEGAAQSLRTLIRTGTQLLNDPNLDRATGPIQGRIFSVGKGPSDFDNNLQSYRDQVVVDTITRMKSLSATGATGFGQLSEKEGARLENSKGSLKQTGSEANLRAVLTQQLEDARSALATVEQGMARIPSGPAAQGPAPAGELPVMRSPQQAARLPRGTRFKLPSGEVRVRN